MSLFDVELVRKENYFTFADLEDAPDYSLAGAEFFNTVAVENFAGTPWDVLRANGMVYNFQTGLVVPLTAVTAKASLYASGNLFQSPGLILPGSLTDDGTRVTDYAAWFSTDSMKFRYSEVTSE